MVVVTAVGFPSNPTVDDEWTNPDTGVTYKWDGVAWNVVGSGNNSGGGDVDLSGDVDIGTDCDSTTLTVKSKTEFECDVNVDGDLTVKGEEVALKKDLGSIDIDPDDIDLTGDVEIGENCDNTLQVHGTSEFDCEVTLHKELTFEGGTNGEGNLSIYPNQGSNDSAITALNSSALRIRTASGDDHDSGKKTHVALERDDDGNPVTKIYHLAEPNDPSDAATKKYVDENAGGGGVGAQIHLAPSSDAPSDPDEGTLWYQTDRLDLYVSYDDAWVPAVGYQNDNALPLSGGALTGPLMVENQTTLATDAQVVRFRSYNNDLLEDNEGGFELLQDGQIRAYGQSIHPQGEDNLVTKKYVDESVVNLDGLDDHYLVKNKVISQTVLGNFYMSASKDEKFRSSTDPSMFRSTRISKSAARTPGIVLGNNADERMDGSPVKDTAHHKAHEVLLRKCEYGTDQLDPIGQPKDKVYIESYDYDRIERIHYLKSTIRKGSNTNPIESPEYESSDVAKPKGHPTNVTMDHTRWRKKDGFFDENDGAPQRFITWIVDPEDEDWEQRKGSDGKDFLSDSCPKELRAANVGYVDRQISTRVLSKGADLCADNWDDPNLEVGGFYRMKDSNSSAYIATRVYMRVS